MHAESAMLCASTELPGWLLNARAATFPSEVEGAPRGVKEKISNPVALGSSPLELK